MPGKPGGATVWDSPAFLMEMTVAFYTVSQNANALSTQAKDAIISYMQSQGHTTTWEAVRQHVQRLRKNRDTTVLQNSASGVPGNGTAAPKKATPRKRATPVKKAAKVIKTDENDQDDILDLKREIGTEDEDSGSPAPAAKRLKSLKLETDFESAAGEY